MKAIFQSIIATMQQRMPFDVRPRDLSLPLHAHKIITVPGVRRCGKSSLLAATANRLLADGVDKSRILWIGFDDERLADMPASRLNDILDAYREMHPQTDLADVYMFFDEIQLVGHWELFVMRVFKTVCKNIYISGSNAEMLSSQLASALRGWPLEYKEYPLSFSEYLRFNDIAPDPWSDQGRAVLRNAFAAYNSGGGFPDPVMAASDDIRQRELQEYFNTMIFRDLIEHYGMGSPHILRYFLKRVMGNLTKPTSVNNIYNEIRSQGGRMGKDKLYEALERAASIFLLFKVTKYDGSLVRESAAQAKYYVIDNGLRQSVLIPQSGDEGKLLENTVFLQLLRTSRPDTKIMYYKGSRECDFVVQEKDVVSALYQVAWRLDDTDRERETGGLAEAAKATGCSNLTIITYDQQEAVSKNGCHIDVVPAWKWLLQ